MVTFQGLGNEPFMFIKEDDVKMSNLVIDGYAENGSIGDVNGGAAIEVEDEKEDIEFTNVVFSNNVSNNGKDDKGGAIHIQKEAEVEFERCIFHNNRVGPTAGVTGYYGAAIYIVSGDEGELEINSCLFYENKTAHFGSAIASYIGSSDDDVEVEVNNSTFADNLSYYNTPNGGPIYSRYSEFELNNCAFANNTYNGGSSTPNEAYGYGGTKEMANCYTTGSSIESGFTKKSCQTLVIAGFTDAANDDYTLTAASGFIDGGNDSNYPSDGDLNTGDKQSTADVGCYEYCASASWDGSESSDIGAKGNWDTDHPACNSLTFTSSGSNPDISGADGLTFTGDFTINSGVTFILSSNESTSFLEVKGNFANSGTFTQSGSATLKFTGTSEQTLNTGGATLKNVEIDNSSGVKLLSNKATISGTLTLTNGSINTNGNILELTSEAASDFSGWSSSNSIIATSAAGALRLHIDNDGTSSETYTYPLGLSAGTKGYYRMDLVNNNMTNNGGTTPLNYLDVYIKTNAESGNNLSERGGATQNGTALSYYSQQEWVMVPDNAPNSGSFGLKLYTANVVLGASGTLADNKFTVVKRSTASDDFADYDSFDGTTTIPAGSQAGRTVASGYAQKLGFTGFSKAGVGGSNDPLPIELVDFNADISDENLVDLTWTTASEVNNDFFTIERSQDAMDFDILATITGAGTSSEMLYYEATDEEPMLGISYYRLKQTDYDGGFTYSSIKAVKNLKELNFSIMPNPAVDRLTLTFGKVEGSTVFVMTPEYKAAIKIFNTEGKLVYRKKFDGTFYKFTIDVTPLPKGMYYINMKANEQIYKSSFLKQ